MTDKASEPDVVDHWLRKGLEPEPETTRRILRHALSAAPPVRQPLIRNPRALLAGAVLLVVLALSIWNRDGVGPMPTRGPVRISNIGELVTAVDPAGNVWLNAPAHVTAAGAPRFIITLGEKNAD